MRRALWWSVGIVLAGSFYLLLIDTVARPEVYALAVIALVCAVAFEAAREQRFAEVAIAARWLARMWRPFASIPPDVARVTATALAQLVRPRSQRGVLRAVPFRHGEMEHSRDAGRRALTELAGSLAPNTIVIGIDPDRDVLLVHQLRRNDPVDMLDLGS